MRGRARAVGLVLLAPALVLVVPAAASADPGPVRLDNVVTVVNTTDRSSAFRLAFSLRRADTEKLTAENAAGAFARCRSCRTVAIAFQIVLLRASAPDVRASNDATAVNVLCRECVTVASAYQFVVVSDRPLRLTRQGRIRLRAAEYKLAYLRRLGGLPADELQARIDAQAQVVRSVLDEGLRITTRYGRLKVDRRADDRPAA